MSQINELIKDLVNNVSEQADVPANPPESPQVEPQLPAMDTKVKGAQQNPDDPSHCASSSLARSVPALGAQDLNPAEVQRVDSRCSNVELLMTDPAITELQKSCRILESLAPNS